MTYDLSTDKDFQAISAAADASGGILMDCWIEYQGVKWFPVVIRDRQSGKRGFEVNYTGTWGKNDEVGRRKLELSELLQSIASKSIPNSAHIRCKRLNDSQRNGRNYASLSMSLRMSTIVQRLRA